MSDDDAPSADAGLVYEDRIPVGWQILEEAPAAWQLLKTQQSNEQVLRYLAAIDDQQHRHDSGDDEHAPAAADIARLESRLNLLLDMVGRLLGQQAGMPPVAMIRLNADRLQWQTPDEVPAVDRLISVDLYLNPRFPAPITLHGRVDRVVPVDGERLVELGYCDLSDVVRNCIEKLVFRQHRRLVALARRGK